MSFQTMYSINCGAILLCFQFWLSIKCNVLQRSSKNKCLTALCKLILNVDD